QSGRFLVQMLDTDAARVESVRKQPDVQRHYGLLSVERLTRPDRLPYTENLVNLLIVSPGCDPEIPMAEIVRVLAPGGVVIVQGDGPTPQTLTEAGLELIATTEPDTRTLARKPFPADMDSWTHPRHAADGNAVSTDRQVGPPRRIRWVTGPSQEVSNVVISQGRSFYGGVWARDSFNGLRLWQRDLTPSPARGGFGFGSQSGSVRPIAAGEMLLTVTDGMVEALDGATGKTIREYPDAATPYDLLHVDGTLLALGRQSVRALDIDSAKLRWNREASQISYVIADQRSVYLIQGDARRGEKLTAVALDLADGSVRWQRDDLDWMPKVRRTVCHDDLVAFEVSTYNNDKEGNAIYVVSADDGKLLFSREYVPGMCHMKQSRVFFIGDLLWILEFRQCVALDPRSGEVKKTLPAGYCHCFPPSATERFLLSGEMELTDLASGDFDANRITKAACGRDAGVVPANGLIYAAPKHCVCWPMLRGYTAMAPALPDDGPLQASSTPEPLLEVGVEAPSDAAVEIVGDWPCYRHDAYRSSTTVAAMPTELEPLWTASLGTTAEGPITVDWQENPFTHGPVTAPVIVGKTVYVARPDAHQVVALDAESGHERWRRTVNGRVDTAPTIHRGLCLFGTRSGWVYCLRADDGQIVWRLRAAPSEAQIVAHGQVESPWPVPGSVLVVDDVAYFAAGRQPLADGGIRVFAVEPTTGKVLWQQRIDTDPTENFYGCKGLEFDCFDLMHCEGDNVVMSRWAFDRTTGKMTEHNLDAFVRLDMGDSSVIAPRGCWTYAPRHQSRHGGETMPNRAMAVYGNGSLLGCLPDQRTIYRRDFEPDAVEKFDTTWITGWDAAGNFRKQEGEVFRSDRLAQDTTWEATAYEASQPNQTIAAMVQAADKLFIAGVEGGLTTLSAKDGKVLDGAESPKPIWDGLATAGGRLFMATEDGGVVCFGEK
ncbi:MAG TPA: PQQ-binding-like beta-propeller repeat protein, partial [Thermoguttaceae bacterium]|nr:PQQ-binding-like beta-propeller repeat protein [Thermoguttaceae bacterium]